MSKTNRSNDIRPHKSLLIALTLAATGFVANNAFAQDADAIRQQADAKVASIEAAIEDGQEMLARARENSNVSQIDCINTQLVIARGFLNVAQNANINLKEAITRNFIDMPFGDILPPPPSRWNLTRILHHHLYIL